MTLTVTFGLAQIQQPTAHNQGGECGRRINHKDHGDSCCSVTDSSPCGDATNSLIPPVGMQSIVDDAK